MRQRPPEAHLDRKSHEEGQRAGGRGGSGPPSFPGGFSKIHSAIAPVPPLTPAPGSRPQRRPGREAPVRWLSGTGPLAASSRCEWGLTLPCTDTSSHPRRRDPGVARGWETGDGGGGGPQKAASLLPSWALPPQPPPGSFHPCPPAPPLPPCSGRPPGLLPPVPPTPRPHPAFPLGYCNCK